jgi:hypothetical protein
MALRKEKTQISINSIAASERQVTEHLGEHVARP